MNQPANDNDAASPCPSDQWACSENCEVRQFELARPCDVRGLLHCHTDYAGGAHDLVSMVEMAQELGLEYLGVTDKASSDMEPNGLDAEGWKFQRAELDALNRDQNAVVLLHGIEVETDEHGGLPLPDADLQRFDYVVATLRNGVDLTREQWTSRAVRAVMHPYVHVLGHPFGDWMTAEDRELPVDLDTVLRAAAKANVAVEIDANPSHHQLDWRHCEKAQELGVTIVIASDVHRAARLADYRHGVELTRQAGLCCRQILNTQPLKFVKEYFNR